MHIERVPIHSFLSLVNGHVLIDVRSPSEYHHAHIPAAISLPLFTDEERAIVGTAYKQQSREQAIKIGLDFFGPKMRSMVEAIEKLTASKLQNSVNEENQLQNENHKPTVLIYCWRGGMRSGAVAWLLSFYGFQIKVLAGGYKSFRRWVLERFSYPYPLKVLGGFTGSGKTELLQELKEKGEPVINLEGIAHHKGSAFGNIGMPPQPTQEMFENHLAIELLHCNNALKKNQFDSSTEANHHKAIWIEDESQRIGIVNIPNAFWQTMRNSPVLFLEIDFEERLKHILEEFSTCNEEVMINAIQRISKRLGGLETKKAITFLQERNCLECFRILLNYYDKQYLKGLHNRQHLSSLLTTIRCPKAGASNVHLLLSEKTET